MHRFSSPTFRFIVPSHLGDVVDIFVVHDVHYLNQVQLPMIVTDYQERYGYGKAKVFKRYV